LLGDVQCCKLFAVMVIGMWGYTPVRITGVLVCVFVNQSVSHLSHCWLHSSSITNCAAPQRQYRFMERAFCVAGTGKNRHILRVNPAQNGPVTAILDFHYTVFAHYTYFRWHSPGGASVVGCGRDVYAVLNISSFLAHELLPWCLSVCLSVCLGWACIVIIQCALAGI